MARSFPLDKIVPAGTTFQTDKREAFIISWIGTNSATDGTLRVEDKRVITIKELVAPLRTKGTNLLGPLDLGDFYIVIPPETKYVWDAPSGTALRIIGTKVQLDPLEQLGEPYTTRYKRQFNEGIVYLEGTYSHGVNAEWIAGLEREVLSIRPSTIEKYVFNSVVMASVENVSGGVNEGDWGITFYLDGQPLEYIHHDGEKRGIEALSMPRPPTTTTEMEAFTLENYPIELTSDHELSIRAVNNSGVSKTPPSGASITVTVTILAQWFRQPI